jgi:hypothetical protein
MTKIKINDMFFNDVTSIIRTIITVSTQKSLIVSSQGNKFYYVYVYGSKPFEIL